VVESEYNGEQTPLIYDIWVIISCIIDLKNDWLQIYYNGEIFAEHAWTDTVEGTGGGTLNITAVDLFANEATSIYYDDIIIYAWSPPVFIDAGGPYSGYVNQDIAFTGYASGGVEPYTWEWDFGDGATASVQNPTHAYTIAGNYTATMTVTDAQSTTASDTATVTIFPHPPDTPTVTGPNKGKPGTTYKYTITGTDPDSDMVSAYIKWGDDTITNWTAYHDSGESFTVTHSWADKGTYSVQVKVKDEYGGESGWANLTIEIPINYSLSHPILNWLFERFPLAFPILRHLMGY
jgi:PKD repeat protein